MVFVLTHWTSYFGSSLSNDSLSSRLLANTNRPVFMSHCRSLLSKVLLLYRSERWWPLVAQVASLGLRSAYQSCQLAAYLAMSAALLSAAVPTSPEERSRLDANLHRVIAVSGGGGAGREGGTAAGRGSVTWGGVGEAVGFDWDLTFVALLESGRFHLCGIHSTTV